MCYSISDRVYPLLFPLYDLKGHFQKILVETKNLSIFFKETPPFDFLTVTMPHKIAVIKYCHEITDDAKAIGSVNYILILKGQILGHNFDGIGALDVIEKELLVYGKRVVIVGAGGAARAAIYEAKKRGALVTCVNRSEGKGRAVSTYFGVEYKVTIPDNYDILINATSVGMDPYDTRCIVANTSSLNGKIILDMASRNGECLLKKYTSLNNGYYISGSEMFYALTRVGLGVMANNSLQNHKPLL